MAINSVDSDQYVDGSIDRVHLAADIIDGTKINNDSIDSEHYVDASIDHQHLSNDCIDSDNIQNDVINSEHIAAGAVDLEHMSSESVDEDNLHISNAGSNGQYLQKSSNSGGLTWATVAISPLRGFKTIKYTGAEQVIPKDAWTDVTDLSITYTPTLSSSIIVLEAHLSLYVRAQDQSSGTVWSDSEQQFIVTPTGGSAATVQEFQAISTGAGTSGASGNVSYGAALRAKWNFYEEYTNSNTTEKTFKVQLKRNGNGTLKVNNQEGHSYFTLKEYTT